jgi:ketosteroid isomerase-like protein
MQLGKLIIKEFPTNTATIYTLRSHIERLDIKGFHPGLIIIDYADIMRSTRQYDSLRHELKLIYEELRALSAEKATPIWTACFHGDTVIKTPYGDKKIHELVGQSNFPVYSYNHDSKRVELRTVKSVYESGKNVEVWKVTLDNGESVIVTPNHKFMKRDGSYCEVRDLAIGDSLMPFNERISDGPMPGRKQIYRNDGSWEFVYKMVAEWKRGQLPKLHQVHHKDKVTVSTKVRQIWDKRDELERKRIGAKIQESRFSSSREDRIKQHVELATQCNNIDEFLERTKNISLRSGDKIMIWNNRNHKVVSIVPCGRADVFNMEVDDLHNYAIGAGIIVKNSQSNKEGANSEVIDLGNMSEAYGKAHVADVVVSLSRKSFEKASGTCRLFIAKNRAGRDGILYNATINTARSKFEIVNDVSMTEEIVNEEKLTKQALRKKWEELRRDPQLTMKDVGVVYERPPGQENS